MKQSGLNEKENNNNTVNEIGLGIIGKRLTPFFRTNKASGYGLIVLVIFLFAAMILFTKPIIISAAKNYRDINLYYAKVVSQRVGIATASPIREHINSVIYSRIQNKLISHTKSFLSEADTYDCQGQQVPTKRAGGKLRNVFSLCDITGIFDDLLGDTNQSIDFAGYLYPDHKTPLQDKKLDMARQSILSQLDNKFDYTLRTIFVAQEILVQSGTKKRIDRYRWLVRGDVETHTYFDVIDQQVLYYDVILDVEPHDESFEGSGTNCNQNTLQTPDELVPGPDFVVNGPNGMTYIFGGGGTDFAPLYVTDSKGDKHPYGSDAYNKICGTLPLTGKPDPYCGQKLGGSISGGTCGTQAGGDLNCTFSDGTSYVGYTKPQHIKYLPGCASPRTNQIGTRDTDPVGYSFTVSTKLVSVGSTFN